MTTLFPRKHQFHELSIREQYEFAKEMRNAWSKIASDTLKDAERDGHVTRHVVGETLVKAFTRRKYEEEWHGDLA